MGQEMRPGVWLCRYIGGCFQLQEMAMKLYGISSCSDLLLCSWSRQPRLFLFTSIFIIAIKLGPGPLTMKDSFVCLPGLDAKKELAGIDFAAVAAEAKKKEDAAQDDHGVPFGTIRAPCRLCVIVGFSLSDSCSSHPHSGLSRSELF